MPNEASLYLDAHGPWLLEKFELTTLTLALALIFCGQYICVVSLGKVN